MPFGSLWIPVVVSAVAVFVVSSILHMVFTYHKANYKRLPDEDAARDALRRGSPGPGLYVIPYCDDMKQMADPAMQERYEKGPVGFVTLRPNGIPAMPRYLALWFGFSMLVSFVSAYVARITLHPGDQGFLAMRVTGTVAFGAYGVSRVMDSIWKGQPWGNTAREMLDGLIYATVTGLTFMLLWPSA